MTRLAARLHPPPSRIPPRDAVPGLLPDSSFHVQGQPTVDTAREALDTRLGVGIEFPFLEHVLVDERAPAD